jgi:hypothetical protein
VPETLGSEPDFAFEIATALVFLDRYHREFADAARRIAGSVFRGPEPLPVRFAPS